MTKILIICQTPKCRRRFFFLQTGCNRKKKVKKSITFICFYGMIKEQTKRHKNFGRGQDLNFCIIFKVLRLIFSILYVLCSFSLIYIYLWVPYSFKVWYFFLSSIYPCKSCDEKISHRNPVISNFDSIVCKWYISVRIFQ